MISEPVQAPVDVKGIVVSKLGLSWGFSPLQRDYGDGIHGTIWLSRSEIWLDESLNPKHFPEMIWRMFFTLAHEVGHWVLHRHFFIDEVGRPLATPHRAVSAVTLLASRIGIDERKLTGSSGELADEQSVAECGDRYRDPASGQVRSGTWQAEYVQWFAANDEECETLQRSLHDHRDSFIAAHADVPVFRIEFAELVTYPEEVIRNLVEFLGITPTLDEIQSAVEHVNPDLRKFG